MNLYELRFMLYVDAASVHFFVYFKFGMYMLVLYTFVHITLHGTVKLVVLSSSVKLPFSGFIVVIWAD